MTSGLIGFGDADAFYSSAEVVRRPWLEGVPLGVLGNKGACVIARSYRVEVVGELRTARPEVAHHHGP